MSNTGQFGDLKETVTFTVQGLDYYMAANSSSSIRRSWSRRRGHEEERPGLSLLPGWPRRQPGRAERQKQRFEPAQVSLQGGEISPIYVPAWQPTSRSRPRPARAADPACRRVGIFISRGGELVVVGAGSKRYCGGSLHWPLPVQALQQFLEAPIDDQFRIRSARPR